jgi:N-methylhydantoinase A
MAQELGIRTVIVPRMAGALSALGMLLADHTRDYSIGALGASDYETRFRRLEKQARKDMRGATLARFADVRYAGQSYELTIPWGASFHKEHHRVYGYSDPKRATQIVTLRVRATVSVERPSLRFRGERPITQRRQNRLVVDYGSTTLVPPGWTTRLDSAGSLILQWTS